MPEGEPLVTDYIHWLSTEVTGLPEVFAGANEICVSVAVEGTLMMAESSVDLAALQASIADSGRDARRVVHEILKKWWHSFSYNYVFEFNLMALIVLSLFSGIAEGS
jgi:hypothetical protein